ncbi:nucleoporin [Lentinus tigrinus ALCF2SS1-6]|uniref:Nucleoporin n=1 Tax=Lentinus tigrinus ALCF2SS1-6 TaxID=1328759 RepID=A0A5C2SIS8_9APHY|nr:nucleoporin [Lentinus tigrinus ALCF2SS1-6]
MSMAFRTSIAAQQNFASTSTSGPLIASVNGGKLRQTQAASKPAPVLDLPALQAASRVLQEQLVKDSQIVPDLGDMISGMPSSASYTVFPDDYRAPFQKRRHIGIPESLWQYYTSTNLATHMGLLPDIDRVWIAIDHNLFLWDYIDGQELSSFVDQPDVITYVALVKPKPGVFIDEITSLLVICTPVTVLLLGVSTHLVPGPNNQTRTEIKLYATDMSIACDVEMSAVIGTPDGRIFMCGTQDGNLYELHYQEKEGWFGKRVQLINHSVGGMQSLLPRLGTSSAEDRIITLVPDPARNCFYSLTGNNAISIWRTNGDKHIQHLQTISNLYKAAQDKVPGSPALTPQNFTIIALHVVHPNESRAGVQLVAVTANGVRLYFSPSSYGAGYGWSAAPASGFRPLSLAHVRLPPPNLIHPDEQGRSFGDAAVGYGMGQAQQAPPRPYILANLQHSCYDLGITVASQGADVADTDYILCMAPDLTQIGSLGQLHTPQVQQPSQYTNPTYGTATGPSRPPLTERATLVSIPGLTWGIAPVPRSKYSMTTSAPANTPTPLVTNELATQLTEPARQYIILNNGGLHWIVKRRAIDALKDVIEEFQVEGNAQPLIEFRDSYGRDQTCAMLLAIASGNTFLDPMEQSPVGSMSHVGADLAAVARQAFYDFGERPTWAERVTYGTSEGSGTATFSGRREGLALYFARLVRPFWKVPITKTAANGLQDLNVPDDVLLTAQKNLFALKELLDTNPYLFHSAPSDHTGARSAAANEQEAWKAEQSSVSQLLGLLGRAIEAISFILLLSDHHLGELISHCEPDIQKLVSSLTFEDLITSDKGVTASRSLVNVIINQQIGQQISVDTISEVLQQRCGSFCSTDDVMLYKARENVRKAVETRNPIERQTWLGESLRLFMKGARNLEFDKLREICGDYQQLSYAKGAVELPLYCAQVFDTDLQGQEYWIAGCPANDARGQFWERRRQCYELVLDSLTVFEERCVAAGKQAAAQVDDPEAVRGHAYELVFASEDEMFHSTLYEWLIGRGMADELLEMRPAYLEAHLRREPVTVEKFQLLWQFYVKDGQPLRAAEVLAVLAESTEFNLSLETRLEYLTLAVSNAKSHPVSVGGRHETAIAFLTDLEEKLDVAQVQLELFNTLLPRQHDPEVAERFKALSYRLYNITELYQLYADPLDLPLIKLLILHVSEHREENIVRPIWNRIFEEAVEGVDAKVAADRIIAKVVPLGQRFYPSESAFPLQHVASLLVRFALAHKGEIPYGWAPRILTQCGVPYPEVWDILHEMYESQVPPFNEQANVQAISSDIAVLLTDWVEEAKRPQSAAARGEFPVFRIDQAVEQYLAELEPTRTETKAAYEAIKRQLRRHW